MLKNVSQLSVKINGKDHLYHCDMDCPTFEVKEALFQMMKYVGQIEDSAKAQQAQVQQEEVSLVEEEIESKIEELKVDQ